MQPLNKKKTSATRYKYMGIARKLTAPLLKAYHEIITITITQRDMEQGAVEYIPIDDEQDEWTMTTRQQLEQEALHVQGPLSAEEPLLSSVRRVSLTNTFTLSDSTLRIAERMGT